MHFIIRIYFYVDYEVDNRKPEEWLRKKAVGLHN